jgi:hypothetical protein
VFLRQVNHYQIRQRIKARSEIVTHWPMIITARAPSLSLMGPPYRSPCRPSVRASYLVGSAKHDKGEFTEGHELDRKWQVPKAMIGRRLSQAEAKRLLAKLR